MWLCISGFSKKNLLSGDMAHLNDQLLKGFRLVAMEAGSGLISKLVERHGMLPPYDHWRLGTCLPYNHLGE